VHLFSGGRVRSIRTFPTSGAACVESPLVPELSALLEGAASPGRSTNPEFHGSGKPAQAWLDRELIGQNDGSVNVEGILRLSLDNHTGLPSLFVAKYATTLRRSDLRQPIGFRRHINDGRLNHRGAPLGATPWCYTVQNRRFKKRLILLDFFSV
jgi:hypothetical protein